MKWLDKENSFSWWYVLAKQKEYLLVDGYNIIYIWNELKEIADDSLNDARLRLIEILSNYQGYKLIEIIVVFDAHKQKGNTGSYEKYGNIHLVYTKEAQTADSYIERFTAENSKKYKISVATSDNLEQIIILGRGATRISGSELLNMVKSVNKEIKENYIDDRPVKNNTLFDNLDPEAAKFFEDMRFGRK